MRQSHWVYYRAGKADKERDALFRQHTDVYGADNDAQAAAHKGKGVKTKTGMADKSEAKDTEHMQTYVIYDIDAYL